MICKFCGTNLDDNSTFCYNCGNMTDLGSRQAAPTPQPTYYSPAQAKPPISIGGWIGRNLIPCIPVVGGLIYLIMLFIWSGDASKDDTFRNWAKAQLIVTGIVIGVMIILGIILAAAGVSIMDAVLSSL